MLARILGLPFFVILMGLSALAMFVPAAHALVVEDYPVMQVFSGCAVLLLIVTALIGIATANYDPVLQARSHLLALLGAFVLLPAILAVPFLMAVPDTSYLNAYVEMVSSITTTGATLFDDPGRLAPSVHLWRALVGWLGGFLALVSAVAILAPLNLGGFEVLASTRSSRRTARSPEEVWATDGSARLQRFGARLFPIYAGLTVLLWILLYLAGDRPLVAISHAMSVMATSGISPIGGVAGSGSGMTGESIMFLFMIFAISRETLIPEHSSHRLSRIITDPEFRMAGFFVVTVPALLFIRHWFGALEVDSVNDIGAGFDALRASIFTVMSFLTTTGFESAAWDQARNWSGLATPGIVLMGLALLGGGVATTAGGVKLLRIYALYKHGFREMDRLVYPSSVSGAGTVARRLRRQGAMIAWVFFMLFGISLTVVVLGFASTGLPFDQATTLGVAALSTTGPLAQVALDQPISYGSLPDAAKGILCVAMVLGRLEILAIIALFNPDFWRA